MSQCVVCFREASMCLGGRCHSLLLIPFGVKCHLIPKFLNNFYLDELSIRKSWKLKSLFLVDITVCF